MDKGMSESQAKQMQCLEKGLLYSDRRKNSNEPTTNHIHSISFAYMRDRERERPGWGVG